MSDNVRILKQSDIALQILIIFILVASPEIANEQNEPFKTEVRWKVKKIPVSC